MNATTTTAAATITSSSAPFGRFLDEYSNERELGAGDFGSVSAAKNIMDQRRYAIKISKKETHSEIDEQARLQEVYALASCGASPHLLRYHDAFLDHDAVHIITELLTGGSARDRHRAKGGEWTNAELWDLFLQCAMGLEVMHSSHVAHLDVKPDNILCTDDDDYPFGVRYTIADFGLARPVDGEGQLHIVHKFVGINDDEGDNRYICPYLVQNGGQTAFLQQADVYSLGATIIELAGGDPRLARSQRDYSLIEARPDEEGDLVDLVAVLKLMTDPQPLRRPTALFAVALATRNLFKELVCERAQEFSELEIEKNRLNRAINDELDNRLPESDGTEDGAACT